MKHRFFVQPTLGPLVWRNPHCSEEGPPMRFPLVLLATLLLFSTTLATVLQLPRYNVNDEEV